MRLFAVIERRLTRYKKILSLYANENTIFIYQMGKVGSTSLEHSIDNAVHIHAFYNANHICPPRLKGLAKFGLSYYLHRVEQQILAFCLRYIFKRRKYTKIITLVRDPFARNISMFFHDLDAYLFAAHTNCMNSRRVPLATRGQDDRLLLDVFKTEFNHQYPATWFDKEFFRMTGLDVYTQPFDIDKGLSRYKTESIDCLCVKSEQLSKLIPEVSAFVSQEVVLTYANVGAEKWYRGSYERFLKEVPYPNEYLSQLMGSRFVDHFFSLEEIELMKKKYDNR